MIELELFYEIMESEIRREQGNYLVSIKRQPLPQVLPAVEDLPEGAEWKKLNLLARWRLKRIRKKQIKARNYALRHPVPSMDDKLLKGFNAGIDCALRTMEREYKAFMKRLEKDDRNGGTL